MPGLLYRCRKALGDVDDILDAKMETLDQLVRHSETMSSKLMEKDAQINSLQADLNVLSLQLRQESAGMQKIQDRLLLLKKELGQANLDRMKTSQLVISLMATQDEQQKKLDDLQNQFTHAQQKEIAEHEQEEISNEKNPPAEAEQNVPSSEASSLEVFDESAPVKAKASVPEAPLETPAVEVTAAKSDTIESNLE